MTFIYVVVGWIFSLCLHEWAHARVAYEGGDKSVKDKGYLSFNPLKYTDPMLSLGLPLLFVLMGGIGLPGGAVYINERALRSPMWRTAVSLAGPAANLLLAIIIGLIFRFVPPPVDAGGPALAFIGMLQVMALLLNLLPVPPLDGYGAISPHLDPNTRRSMDAFAGWGFFAVFFMLWFVPPVRAAFWMALETVCMALGIPLDLAEEGRRAFMFWR